MYGTHVLTKITVGGSYRAYYKSVIVEEANRTEKMKTVTAGAKYNMKRWGSMQMEVGILQLLLKRIRKF